jgi:hypothetical protein
MKKTVLTVAFFGFFLLFQQLGAQTWGKTKRLTWTSGQYGSMMPAIAVDINGHIHVVWYDKTPGNFEIYYTRSTDGGGTWNSAKRLTWNSGDSTHPAIALGSNDHLHVTWMDDTPVNLEIFYKKSTNGGTNWTTKRLTYSSGYSFFPDIAINMNNHIYIAYEDDTGESDDELYRKRSTDHCSRLSRPYPSCLDR